MAKILEICGVPGVGKSTIFSELERIQSSTYKWKTITNQNPVGDLTKTEFTKKIIRDILEGRKSKNPRTQIKETNLQFIKRIYRTIKLGRKFVDTYILKEAGLRFTQKYPEYIDACWKNIYLKQAKNSNGLDLRFEKAEFIYLIIKKIQILMEQKSDKIMITDEGLINMIDRVLYNDHVEITEFEEIERRVAVMPLPNAIVYIKTDLDEITRRIQGRKDIRDMHKNLNQAELKDFTKHSMNRIETAINFLAERGIPVMTIDLPTPFKKMLI